MRRATRARRDVVEPKGLDRRLCRLPARPPHSFAVRYRSRHSSLKMSHWDIFFTLDSRLPARVLRPGRTRPGPTEAERRPALNKRPSRAGILLPKEGARPAAPSPTGSPTPQLHCGVPVSPLLAKNVPPARFLHARVSPPGSVGAERSPPATSALRVRSPLSFSISEKGEAQGLSSFAWWNRRGSTGGSAAYRLAHPKASLWCPGLAAPR